MTKNQILKIVFWGEDAFSNVVLNSLIQAGHDIKMVVSPLYNNLVYKKLEYTCHKYQIPFYRFKDINSREVVDLLNSFEPDICVIAHFQRLIKGELLNIPKKGFINLHPSLLPDYRGMSPQHWPIINGEKESGVTVHYVDSGVDTGDIIIQEKFSLNENDYVSDLQNKWIKIYDHIMIDAINRIMDNSPVIVQRHLAGRYYGKLRSEECIIKKDITIREAYNLIRGVSMPYQGAQMDNVIIWKAHPVDKEYNDIIHNSEYPVGVYINSEKGNFLRLKDGVLIIDKYKIL